MRRTKPVVYPGMTSYPNIQTARSNRLNLRFILQVFLALAVLAVVGILIWQGVSVHGNPDPTRPHTSPTVAFLDIGVLVFREGLECILVLAAITASMVGARQAHRRPVALGAAIAFGGTLITWFIAVGIMGQLTESVPALDLQAATGLLAVIVLLVIMNWFFHKIYWGGWIRAHNRRRKTLLASASTIAISQKKLWWGFILLGFTSLYREGFEVVLFLQSYNLRLGGGVVLEGCTSRFDPFRLRRHPHFRSAAASALPENVDHNRHSPRRRSARDGGRTSAGDAARALAAHDHDPRA